MSIIRTLTLCILSLSISLFSEDDTELLRQLEAEKRAYAEYIGYVNEIRSTFAEQMEKELNLHCIGSSGMMHEKIEDLGMKFFAYRRSTVNEARALHLLALDKFVKAVNAHEKIQPFLEVRPFTYERANISIAFMKKNQGFISDGSVSYVSNVTGNAFAEENRNKLFYSSYDPFTESLNDILEESYPEATAFASSNPIIHPEIHQGNAKEELLDQLFASFAEEVKNQLGINGKDIGGQLGHDIETVSGNFVMFQQADQDKARQLIVNVTEKLLKKINEQKKLDLFYKDHPFPSKRVKMRISFRTKKNGYYYETSVKDVTLEDDKIAYDKAVKTPDDLTGVVIIGTETYSEALQKISTNRRL